MSTERNRGPTSRKLGEYLKVDPNSIDEALAVQRHVRAPAGHRRVGDLLLELDAVELGDLLGAVQAQRVDRLRACPLFAVLSDEELERLSAEIRASERS